MSRRCGAMSSSRARAAREISSAPRRDRTKASVRAPCATRSANIRAASAPAERRTGAPFSPRRSVRNAGSHNAIVRAPCGDPSTTTSSTGRPISSAAVAPGAAVVALAKITVVAAEPGERYRSHSRSSRRRIIATFEPKTPR